jgi:hypothetical protein
MEEEVIIIAYENTEVISINITEKIENVHATITENSLIDNVLVDIDEITEGVNLVITEGLTISGVEMMLDNKILYGTGDAPSPIGLSDGTLYVKYVE